MKNHPYYQFDDHKKLVLPGNLNEAIEFSADEWIRLANECIKDHHFFAVALSGGSTPKKIYEKISEKEDGRSIDWEKVFLFWSDERSVNPDSLESNYCMSMQSLEKLTIPQENIFRMIAEKDLENNASAYESTIQAQLKGRSFDLIMLGMGEDGHTASLFPHTEGLHEDRKLVIANHVPQKNTWRMTFTYKCINEANNIHIYVMGKNKAEILEKVFTSRYTPTQFPIQKIGTKEHPSTWIIDDEASQNLLIHLK